MFAPDRSDAFCAEGDAFWSDSYRGHVIATLNHGKGWLVYLDHVLQHNKLFVSADAAVAWMRRQVDSAAHRGAH